MKSDSEPFCLLMTDRLRAGDVLLIKGNTKLLSNAICRYSQGPFSHAVLVVSWTQLFEALGDGVGPTIPDSGYITRNGRGTHVIRVEGCTEASLYRHPLLAKMVDQQTQSALEEIIEPLTGLTYSQLPRLLEALRVGGRTPMIVEALASAIPKSDKQPPGGIFCSELIALVFESLAGRPGFEGAGLFDVDRHAELVSPNDLAISNLQQVDGAIIWPDDLAPGDDLTFDRREVGPRDFTAAVTRLNMQGYAIKRETTELQKLGERMREQCAKMRADSFKEAKIQSAKMERNLRTTEVLAVEASMPTVVEECQTLRSQLGQINCDLRTRLETAGSLDQARAMSDFRVSYARLNLESYIQAAQVHEKVIGEAVQRLHSWRDLAKRWQYRRRLADGAAGIERARAAAAHSIDGLQHARENFEREVVKYGLH